MLHQAITSSLILNLINALSLDLKRAEKRCFFKEAQDQLITLEYKIFNKIFDSPSKNWLTIPGGKDQAIDLSVKGDDGKQVAQREIDGFGNFTFYTEDQAYDRYLICFEIPRSTMKKMRSPDFRISYKIYTKNLKDANYEKIMKERHAMTITERYLSGLRQQCFTIMRTFQMRKNVEKMFRQESEAVNTRVLIWALVTSSVCVALAVMQTKYMTWWFISKKIL